MTKRPNAYAFSCGAVERIKGAEGEVVIWKEHGTYHARRTDWLAHGGRWHGGWLTEDSLSAIRKTAAALSETPNPYAPDVCAQCGGSGRRTNSPISR